MADIMIMDGGSTDGSLDTPALQALGVRAVLVKTGPGRLSAQLRCAYAAALDDGYLEVVTIDGNDKDDPETISRFIAGIRTGWDFLQASRFVSGGVAENTPKIRDAAIRLIHAPVLSAASRFRWTDTTQGYRAYSRRLLASDRLDIFRPVFADYELLAYITYRAPRLGFRCAEIGTRRVYPADGTVPTKISAWHGNFRLIRTLARAARGGYDPR
jgi:dolichol-phosphate mannosyltransferase